jgi:hypothetical protein
VRWRFVAALLGLAGVSILAISGAARFARREYRRAARARHASRGETELRIVNPAGAAVSLRHAGATLDAVEDVPLPPGECWLPPGRYFVEAATPAGRQLFPVTLEPPLDTPDGDSVWTVTVRRPAATSWRPPRRPGASSSR